MTTFANADGSIIGETTHYEPANGISFADPLDSTNSTAATSSLVAGSSFNITLDFGGGGLTPSQQAIFSTAAARWETIITGDLADVNGIDDVRISATGKTIDGVGNILGQAGYTALRSTNQLPYQGTMSFDAADLSSMEAGGGLLDVITHEMGHVLGVGTLWSRKSLIQGAGTTASRFTGANALAEYKRFTGDLAASSIPVETDGGAGTADAHWDDGTFGGELMTGYLSGTNQLSRMSAASLIDVGYPLVNVDAAQLFTLGNALPVVGTLTAATVSVGAPLVLSLASASDANGVGSVNFYRETNGIPGLQATGTVAADTLVGSGTSLSAAANGLGVGTYTFYARASDAFGAYSAIATASGTVSNTVTPPATPAMPDLASGSDTGDSNADNITSNARPIFAGVVGAGATVTLYVDGNVAGTAVADANGQYAVMPLATLSNGGHAISVTSTTSSGTSGRSANLAVSIDTVGGSVTAFSYDREQAQRLSLTFNDPTLASRLSASSLTLTNTSTGQTFPLGIVATNSSTGVVTLAASTRLGDGKYVLSVPAGAVRDLAGNGLQAGGAYAFAQLSGDANNDGVVNFNDLLTLASNFNTAGGTVSSGNFDYSSDGLVGFNDLLILAANFNQTVESAAAAAQSREATAAVIDAAAAMVGTAMPSTDSVIPDRLARPRTPATDVLGGRSKKTRSSFAG